MDLDFGVSKEYSNTIQFLTFFSFSEVAEPCNFSDLFY